MQFFSKQQASQVIEPKTLSLEQAGEFLTKYMIEAANPNWINLFESAKSGVRRDYDKCISLIEDVLNDQQVTVVGFSPSEAAREIFSQEYGLRDLDAFLADDAFDEIKVTPNGRVWVVEHGRTRPTDLVYTESEMETLINRLKPVADVGVSLDEGNPTMELVRPDGLRLSALCSPVTSGFCFVLRKHGNFKIEQAAFISAETFDKRTGDMLRLFARGRRNILICGGTNSGKTTILKWLATQLSPYLSICVLDNDNELKLAELCPNREIWELEGHPERGATIPKLFKNILRLSPNVIIVPEFRDESEGEVWTAIQACTRGHDGSMATAHFSSFASPEEAIRNTAMLAVQEKANLPVSLAIERVAEAFQVVIQTYWDASKGIRKVTAVTEVAVNNGNVSYNPLVAWEPFTDDYTGEGRWQFINPPSDACLKAMKVYGITTEEVSNVWGDLNAL